MSVWAFWVLFGWCVLLSFTLYDSFKRSHQQQRQQVQQAVENLSQYLNNELGRFENIPRLLASNYMIRKGLEDNLGSDELNHLLLEVASSSGDNNDVYVMNAEGLVLASSNYQSEQSFVQANFAFRPYFQQAMQGDHHAYYALGVRSGERGVFFSAPVVVNAQTIGVVTVKVEVAQFEQNAQLLSGLPQLKFLAYGEDQVVFLSNEPSWQLAQLQALPSAQWQALQTSRRYLDLTPQVLTNRRFQHATFDSPLWAFSEPQKKSRATASSRTYFYAQAELPLLQLNLVALLPEVQLNYQHLALLALVTVLYLLLLLVGFYLYRHFMGYQQLLFTQRSLALEVEQRSKALAEAQDALVQSAKLATIGQLSASINHEINQPLSAMSTYLVSSKRMLDKGMIEEAKTNLNTLSVLVERVHKIVAQLKQFSRSDRQGLQHCDLQICLNNALMIVGPQMKAQGVEFNAAATDLRVYVDPLRFEQVLVNLLSNAVDAMAESHLKQLNLSVHTETDEVTITIADTGQGLDLQQIDTIFEPFFTTKSNHGLGLGLSVSRNIIRSFQGELSAENRPEGGAIFTIHLKREADPCQ
ncbi:hypothetical protein BTE48_10435 [Oceanospirillum multiglobuliferum]|uniref:C4-dicarboxylate transport sensor protein DctB n=1 Tax=Oceanospirillum multiglobuliferum TaxID=64969 RepID=A0A1V4T3S8_9GAMM|nr:hypothetical protein BTE48_10435 [Oceanospirillum multiglobuliferum]